MQKREHLKYQLSVNKSMSETLASEVTATPDEYQRNITLFIETHLGKVDRFPQFEHRFLIQATEMLHCFTIVKLRQGSGKDLQGMAVKAKGHKA